MSYRINYLGVMNWGHLGPFTWELSIEPDEIS